jgi:hypothetical protein
MMENLMKTSITEKIQLICLSCLAFGACNTALAQQPVVSVYGIHYGGKVQYHYRLVNNGPYEISSVWIGRNRLNDENDIYELKSDPYGMVDSSIPAASVTSPPGWEALSVSQEEMTESTIEWHVANANTPRLPIGQTLSGMSITLDETDSSYVTSHATIHFSNRPSTDDVVVPLQRVDTAIPTLAVTLTPIPLHPNGKLTPITATITVKDDYDPAPEIKLESITPSEPAKPGDIRDASLGTDDRQFMLKAERDGRNKTGRVYTVIYSATDASGNKATASATVTVQHDDGGHDEHGRDDRRDDKDRKDKDEHKRDR